MALSFQLLIAIDLLVAIPIMLYYYHWGVSIPSQKGANKKEILNHIKNAYALTGIATFLIPLLLLYYLYDNLLFQFPGLFNQTALIMAILILIFEYVNYYSYIHYERGRLRI